MSTPIHASVDDEHDEHDEHAAAKAEAELAYPGCGATHDAWYRWRIAKLTQANLKPIATRDAKHVFWRTWRTANLTPERNAEYEAAYKKKCVEHDFWCKWSVATFTINRNDAYKAAYKKYCDELATKADCDAMNQALDDDELAAAKVLEEKKERSAVAAKDKDEYVVSQS